MDPKNRELCYGSEFQGISQKIKPTKNKVNDHDCAMGTLT